MSAHDGVIGVAERIRTRKEYVVIADHVTVGAATHRAVYGPFTWSAAIGYADHLVVTYDDRPMRLDGQECLTRVIVESMYMPPGEW